MKNTFYLLKMPFYKNSQHFLNPIYFFSFSIFCVYQQSLYSLVQFQLFNAQFFISFSPTHPLSPQPTYWFLNLHQLQFSQFYSLNQVIHYQYLAQGKMFSDFQKVHNSKKCVFDTFQFQIINFVLRRQIRFKSISDFPVIFFPIIQYFSLLSQPYFAISGLIKPTIELIEYIASIFLILKDHVAQAVEDKDIFLQKSVRIIRNFLFLNLAVPFVQNIYKKAKLFMLVIQIMFVEFLKLEAGIGFRFKQLLYVLLNRVQIMVRNYVLQ